MVIRAIVLASLASAAGAVDRPRCSVTVSPRDDVQRAVDRVRAPAVVCLRAGEFRLGRFVALARDGIVLRGAGPATVLRLADGVQSPVVVVGDWERRAPRHATRDVTIERLRIVGGGRGGDETVADRPYLTNSAVVVRAGRNVAIRDVSLSACRSACIVTERDTRDLAIERDDVGGAVWDGIALNRTVRARVVGNTIHDNTAAGISTEHLELSIVADNVVRDNRTHGLYLSDSYRNTIAANRFTGNVLSGVFVTCAVRDRAVAVRCWDASMSARNVFEQNRFVGNRVGYMVGADGAAPCTRPGFVPNVSRGDSFVQDPREDPRATAFGRCIVYARRASVARTPPTR